MKGLLRRYRLAAVTLLALLVIGAAAVLVIATRGDDAAEQTETTAETADTGGITVADDGYSVSYDGIAGQTALATLKALTEVRSNASSYGEYVTGIAGLDADENAEFWAFYVNGQLAGVGADQYIAEEGDSFEWRLETIRL